MILDEYVEGLLYKHIKPESIVSLGTGESNELFLQKLGLYSMNNDLKIKVVPTSNKIGLLCGEMNLKTVSLEEVEIDVAFDFVDQVDEDFNYISNETTSLIRDKMIAEDAAELIVVCPENKFIPQLSYDFRVEVSNFSFKKTLLKLMNLGEAKPAMEKGQLMLSETGHYFVDIKADNVYSIDDLDYQAKKIPGVLETSFFIGYADRVLLYGKNIVMKSRLTNNEKNEE